MSDKYDISRPGGLQTSSSDFFRSLRSPWKSVCLCVHVQLLCFPKKKVSLFSHLGIFFWPPAHLATIQPLKNQQRNYDNKNQKSLCGNCFQEFSLCSWPTVTDFPILILSVKSEWELLKYGVYCLVSKNLNMPLQSFEIQWTLKMATIGRLQVSDGNENLNQTQFVMKPCACISHFLPTQ